MCISLYMYICTCTHTHVNIAAVASPPFPFFVPCFVRMFPMAAFNCESRPQLARTAGPHFDEGPKVCSPRCH